MIKYFKRLLYKRKKIKRFIVSYQRFRFVGVQNAYGDLTTPLHFRSANNEDDRYPQKYIILMAISKFRRRKNDSSD